MNAEPAYAGFVSRAVAFSIDTLIALLGTTIGYQVVRVALDALGVSDLRSGDGGLAALGYLFALPIAFVAYCAGFWALMGRTPGMLLLGLRVVTMHGERPGVGRSVIRALAYWVSAIFLIGFAWIAVDRRSQGFHDKLARTFVVYDWRPTRAARRSPP
jgi:uncharacterized RDD family membrane protein YckC